MLDGLASLDWRTLSHAYGPAEDVPGMLRDLTSRDTKTRARAHTLLYGAILHQGTVYEATSAAAPFLIELAGIEDVPDRAWILGFLASVAKETEFIFEPPQIVGDPLRQERMRHGRLVARQTREAVRAGLSLFLRLLNHPDHTIRAAATRPIANLREDAAGSAAALRERLSAEEDDAVRRRITASLAKLSRHEKAAGNRDDD